MTMSIEYDGYAFLIKKILLYKMGYFPEPVSSKNEIEFRLELSNFAKKSDIENVSCVYTSKFAINNDIYIDKLEITPVDLSKLSDVVKIKLNIMNILFTTDISISV